MMNVCITLFGYFYYCYLFNIIIFELNFCFSCVIYIYDTGVHMATTALIVDASSGWTPPRHLYTDNLFRVWGNLPYAVERGDYLTDSLYDLAYPGYRDSSYWRNESGFSAPTPFGDSIDLLTSDAPGYVYSRYDTILVAGTPNIEVSLQSSKLLSAFHSGYFY